MGSADLRATFGEKRHELNVSTHQMVILLLFNEAERLSYREIAQVGHWVSTAAVGVGWVSPLVLNVS